MRSPGSIPTPRAVVAFVTGFLRMLRFFSTPEAVFSEDGSLSALMSDCHAVLMKVGMVLTVHACAGGIPRNETVTARVFLNPPTTLSPWFSHGTTPQYVFTKKSPLEIYAPPAVNLNLTIIKKPFLFYGIL